MLGLRAEMPIVGLVAELRRSVSASLSAREPTSFQFVFRLLCLVLGPLMTDSSDPVSDGANSTRGMLQKSSAPGEDRRSRFRFLSSCLGLLLACGLGEVAARIFFHQSGQRYETLRAHLANEVPRTARIIGQPYLLYVPAPDYTSGRNYHNSQGYRGSAVTMRRTPGVTRVLCLGGSTTYGNSVDAPEEAYPARLAEFLNRQKPESVDRVEVINGGLEYATTAELLTHYHFKFHYYRPDLVVINTGGNDGLPPSTSNYQPDYSHWRRQPQAPRPLAPVGQQLMRSRLFALALISLMYGQGEGHLSLDRVDGVPPTVWYETDDADESTDLNPAFGHNLNRLIEEIVADGGRVLLVPYRLAPNDAVPEEAYVRQNEVVLKRIAEQRQLAVAPFPASVIALENWVDGSHLNASGCQEKAQHIAEYARRALWPDEDVSSALKP